MKKTAIIALAVVPFGAFAQSLSTAAPNNGTGGVFMELTDLTGSGLFITEFDTVFGSGTIGTQANVEIWTRPGTYAGFTASSAGWTLHETAVAFAGGTSTWVPINMVNDIAIASNATVSVYLHSTTTGNGIRYTGTGALPPQTTWSDANIQLFSNISRTGAIPFGGSQFTPRTFSGTVYYSPVPEPATIAALAAGFALLALRRRK
jgi:hypothetical protein